NDANPGTFEEPWKTLTYTETQISKGDTVYVRAGLYNEALMVDGLAGVETDVTLFSAYPGEAVIIDGNGVEIGAGGALVFSWENYVHFTGFEIRNVEGGGVFFGNTADHSTVSYCTIHNVGGGIGIGADYCIAEYCTVHDAAMENYEGASPGGYGSGISIRRYPSNCIIRHCIAHDVWGEGISIYEADNSVIEDCIVYNCYSINLYVSDATECTAQRNLVYQTKAMADGSCAGIYFTDELAVSSDNKCLNNIVFNTSRNFNMVGRDNTVVENNTFVNAVTWEEGSPANYCVVIYSSATDEFFRNNVIIQEDAAACISCPVLDPSFTISNNIYNKAYDPDAVGDDDIIEDPIICKIGSTGAGLLTGNYFELVEGSSAINAAKDIDLADDYFKDIRDNTPNIGAIEGLLGLSTLLNGLVSVWELDETTGDAIDLHGTNDGTVSVTTQGASGKIGTAYAFDGINDYIELTPTASGTSFTIAKWVYRDATQTDDYGDLFTNADGSVGLFLGKTGYLNYYLTHDHLSSSTVTASTWTHVAISVSSGVGTLYINGAASGTVDHSISTFNYERIGYHEAEPYKGSIDAIRFWNRGLTQGEITELYTKENVGTTYLW
ncbi:MAG TPA: LamG-like jellyroll fold domain-containing protein, partial [Bacteroidales bacterium]|nr:LamG-like jellyroll fold domain-containing protein [Bacteroidales bacterium]